MLNKTVYKIQAKVFLYPGMAAWHFISIPKDKSKEIKEIFGAESRGWGSLPIEATLGKTTWETSIFPDKKSESYLLPLKADVRKKEKILKGDEINLLIRIKV